MGFVAKMIFEDIDVAVESEASSPPPSPTNRSRRVSFHSAVSNFSGSVKLTQRRLSFDSAVLRRPSLSTVQRQNDAELQNLTNKVSVMYNDVQKLSTLLRSLVTDK